MTVEIRPLGDRCNLRCQYCYENPLRDYNLPKGKPDWEVIKKRLKQHNTNFTVFGGEPLLVPIKELEEIWKFGKENWKRNGIQTNGSLITPKHIVLFRRYSVHVGFSIDGPRSLNDARRAPSGTLSATRRLTSRSNANLLRLLTEKIRCSLICTLSKMNASRERLPELVQWFKELEGAGLKNCRLHMMENNDADDLVLEDDELADTLYFLYEFSKKSKICFDLFTEMEQRLRTGTGGTCVYQECDPCNTRAVQGVGPDGEATNCGRANKEGIDFLKSRTIENTRSYVLRVTRQEDRGCRGCPYWYACKGNCPGTGINGDWRNRTSHCAVLKRLFGYISRDKEIKLLESLPEFQSNSDHINTHGDHTNNRPHGDSPHGDSTKLPRLEVRT